MAKTSALNKSRTVTVVTALLATALFLGLAGQAQAEPTKFYSAARSLTGSCVTTTVDPVPDPGCPDVAHPPEGPLAQPTGVAADSYGDIYVVNRTDPAKTFSFHVDIFDSTGRYLTRVAVPGAENVVVDSKGYLYVLYTVGGGTKGLLRYDPTIYDPIGKEIVYGSPPVVLIERGDFINYSSLEEISGPVNSVAVDTSNDHVYLSLDETDPGNGSERGRQVAELSAPVDGVANAVIARGIARVAAGHVAYQIAVDASRKRIYQVVVSQNFTESEIRVYDSRDPYPLLFTIDGSDTPNGQFLSLNGVQLAVDEVTGHLFVGDNRYGKRTYEFDESGQYIDILKRPPTIEVDLANMAIDNWPTSPNRGVLYQPSGFGTAGNLFAFEPKLVPKPPLVEEVTFGGITEDEAVLRGIVNPQGAPAHWILEYVTQQQFDESGFAAAQLAGEGDLSPSNEGVKVSAPATGLAAGTAYRLRLRAENQCLPGGCAAEKEASFKTFKLYAQVGACSNQALRTGASAALPDCRAYELVTPGNTGGLAPYTPVTGVGGDWFATPPASPDGNSLAYLISGGVIPGLEGTGTFSGDVYTATRTDEGWRNQGIGPSGTQAVQYAPGGLSPDHSFSAVDVQFGGSLSLEGNDADYVRYPDGSFHLVGDGSIGMAPKTLIDHIAPGGSHIIFSAPGRLEPAAPENSMASLYDRTADGILHVVSLLPGEVTPPNGETATFGCASRDGSAVAFSFVSLEGKPLYLRIDNSQTQLAAPAGSQSAGLSADGRYLFYLGPDGDFYRYDSEIEGTARITETGDAVPVAVAASGSGAYFVSPTTLVTGVNPNGSAPVSGADNLYYWDGSATRFVGTVTERDVEGFDYGTIGVSNGLGLLLEAVDFQTVAKVPARTSPDGSTFLFESRADLTGYGAGGKAQIYRYDSVAESLECLSCDPTGGISSGDASLATVSNGIAGTRPVGRFSHIPNLSPDGRRAFFETPDRLVVGDNDNVTDVYEWEAEGKGSCAEPGGCLFLISSGQSARANYLFGVSESGNDVFFYASDLLSHQDIDETPSVYDARVGGGFPPPPARLGECLGEACQPAASAPRDSTPNSASYRGEGNVAAKHPGRRSCPKGKRRARKAGKPRCVRAHKKHHRKSQGRSGTERRAHR